MDRPEKITFAEMRAMGVVGVLIYCADHTCSHCVTVADAGRWRGDVRLSDIEAQFVCTRCGGRGAEVRPHFGPTQKRVRF